MSILNYNFIKTHITNNQILKNDINGNPYIEYQPVKYRWSHGASDMDMGDGLLVYSLIQYIRARVCVCIGSGGGFIPRIMNQAREDLHTAGIFEGDNHPLWGDIGTTIVVDANNGVGGTIDWYDEESFFRKRFEPRIIFDTSENAFYNFFIKEDIKIDYLHIDGDHSYEGVKKDFDLYSKILSDNGIVSIHDTDLSYHNEYIVTKDIKEKYNQSFEGPNKFVSEIDTNEWEIINMFNNGIKKDKPSSTGFTILRKK